ncbi:MAG: nucleotidyltransferase family protein [Acidobacteria bacterium]|nr:nucleotidyltransferase family protein [Acidobacteriota bacterium]
MAGSKNNYAALRVENRLILLCARRQRPPDTQSEVNRLLLHPLDWDYIVKKALHHRIYPLLYNTLRQIDSKSVPTAVLSKLRSETYQNAARNVLSRQELFRLLRRLQEDHITAAPFKGPLLAESVYDDLSLRVFCDLDILVPPDQVLKAKTTLVSMGYQPQFPLNPAEEKIYIRSNCEYNFLRPAEDGTVFQVEVHWNVIPPLFRVPLGSEFLWRGASEMSVGDIRFYQLSLETQFLILCLHAWKHFWSSLQWLCDLNEFLACYQDRLDWDLILAQTQSLRIESIVATSVSLIHNLFGRDIPGALRTHLRGQMSEQSLPQFVTQHTFPADEPLTSLLRKHRFYLSYRKSLMDRVAYLWLVLVTPTPTDFGETPLPAHLGFMYWLVRPWRLVFKTLSGRQRL